MNVTEGFNHHLAAAQETEQLIREMLAAGRSLQVIVAKSAWSLFEVRQIATAEGYDFTKEGAPFKPPTKATRGRHPTEAAAHPLDDEQTRPQPFVPSPAPDPDPELPPNCHVQVMPGLYPEPEHPATATTAAPRIAADTEEADAMANADWVDVVRAGLASPTPRIRVAAERATQALEHLERLVTHAAALERARTEKAAQTAAAKARVAALEKELADARAALHPPRVTIDVPNPGHRTAAQLTYSQHLQAMRVWGRANGFDVPNVGRVRTEIVQAYREAHPDEGAQ